MAAKRARRKKREREKGKQKGDVEGDLALEDASEVAWQDRVQSWCNIRTNAKIKSFALSENVPGSSKSGVPVCFSRLCIERNANQASAFDHSMQQLP